MHPPKKVNYKKQAPNSTHTRPRRSMPFSRNKCLSVVLVSTDFFVECTPEQNSICVRKTKAHSQTPKGNSICAICLDRWQRFYGGRINEELESEVKLLTLGGITITFPASLRRKCHSGMRRASRKEVNLDRKSLLPPVISACR